MLVKGFSPKSLYLHAILNNYSKKIKYSFCDRARETLSRIGEKEKKIDEYEKSKKFNSIYMSNPDSIIMRRRLQQNYVNELQKQKAEVPAIHDAYGDIDVSFDLLSEHDSYDSQLIEALLNYYKIVYKRNNNLVFLTNFMNVYGDNLKEKKYPVLRAYFPFESYKYIEGSSNILKFLVDHNFIFDAKHITSSGYALQSAEFATNTLLKNLDTLFWSPVLTFENIFKSSPETYRQDSKTPVLLRAIRLNLQKIFINIIKNYVKRWKNRQEYKNAKKMVLDNLEEWAKRLGKNDYHGGNQPDEADFAVITSLYLEKV